MSKKKQEIQEDLRKWVQEKWVDIGAPDGKGGYKPCGRSKGEKRKGYPKCVPLSKARSMSKGQKRSAVKRKRAAGNAGPKPTMVKTMKEERMQSLQEKLCARGKAAAKRKFKVYPSAYANLYGSAVCSGKVTPGGKKKKKKKKRSRKNESSYYNIGLAIFETISRQRGGGLSKATTSPDPKHAPTAGSLLGHGLSKAQRRKEALKSLPAGAESTTPQTGKIPGSRRESTVYHDIGMIIAEEMGLVKKTVKAVGKMARKVARKIGDRVVASGNKKIRQGEAGEASGADKHEVKKTARSGHRRLRIGQAIQSLGGKK